MHQAINLTEYNAILNNKLRASPEIRKHYAACMHTLISRWAARVNSHQLAILMFVFDRTFYHAKMSETVVFDQFLHGMESARSDEMIFCGLTMSKNTLSMQLKALCDEDFLHVRACISADGKTETKPRLYAINCKRLFNLDLADEENPMILREPKQKRVAVERDFDTEEVTEAPISVLKQPRKRAFTPPPNLGDIYSINTDTKVSIVGDASLAEPHAKVDVRSVMENLRKSRLDAVAARKAQYPTKAYKPTAKDSRASLQEHIDTVMARVHPNLPRMTIADKPLGVLKKRVVAAQIDIEQFVAWAIEFWQSTTSSHERASRKNAGTESKYVHKPMPGAPDFTTLAYRSPYFIACYRSHVHAAAAGVATSQEDVLRGQVEKLKRNLVAAKQAATGAELRERSLRQRQRQAPPERAPAPPTRIRRTAPAQTAVIDFDDELPPAWDDHAAPARRRK